MTTEEAKNLKIGAIVSPKFGVDKGKSHTVIDIWKNPSRKSTDEYHITAVPNNPEEIESCFLGHKKERCNQQIGWELISQ